MTKKDYPPWHYFVASAIAALFTFNLLTNPKWLPGYAFLVATLALFVIGLRKRSARRAASVAGVGPGS